MNFNFKRDENYFRITQKTYFCDIVLIYSTPHQQVIFEGKLSTIIIFKQCIKCQVDVNRVTLWGFFSYERCPWYFSPLGICSGTYLHDPVPSGCFVFIFKSVSQFQRYMLFLRFEKKPMYMQFSSPRQTVQKSCVMACPQSFTIYQGLLRTAVVTTSYQSYHSVKPRL